LGGLVLIKNNLYFRNVSRRWKKEAVSTNSLTFFSPYITSSTAETVLLENEHLSCEIYTVFKAENFACRASSLKTLKRLIQSGCELFHIDDLHAKVMLSDDFISIGSQNLTNKGKSNLEASFCSDDPNFIKYTQTEVENWINIAEEMTLEMIEDMEEEIASLIKEYDKFKSLFNFTDEVVANKEAIRKLQEKENNARIRNIFDNALNIVQSNKLIFADVRQIINHGEYGDETYTYSLIPSPPSASFLHWHIEGKEQVLEKKNRYLFMDIESGRVAWARVNKGRITYFCDSVFKGEEVFIGEWLCKLGFESNWSDFQPRQNLTISISYMNTDIKLVYECHFDLKFLTDICLKTDESQNLHEADEIILWNKTHFEEFSESIAHHMLSPFVYTQKLTGKEANKFFIQPTRWREISLGLINGFPILLSKLNK
jgi:hypothetical protein